MAMLNAPIVLLREGTESSQGKEQIMANINVCQAIAEILKSTLGPRGMDKLIHIERNVTITNDGATILGLLQTDPPVAKLLVELAQTQDQQVGDGTTSIVLLACELLQAAKGFLEDGISPQVIVHGFQLAMKKAIEELERLGFTIDSSNKAEHRSLLLHVAATALNSKLLSPVKAKFAEMIVSTVESLDAQVSLDVLAIKKVSGGSISDSFLIKGVAFKKTFSYAGFEQQPKKFETPKILLLNVELELKAEKDNAEIRLTNPEDYQSIVQAEWDIIYKKLDNCLATGANIVLSKLPIGDLATQYFADHHVFCAGRVEDNDLHRLAKASGASIQSTTNGLQPNCLGTCGNFEEIQIGDERWNIFQACPNSACATIVLRGCATRFIEEAERSVHDSVMVVCRTAQNPKAVCGAGSIEMKLSFFLRNFSKTISGKEQIIVAGFARALEIIPICLARNSGMDITAALGTLRKKHCEEPDGWWGVNCLERSIFDAKENFVWEPMSVRFTALQSATALANLVLSIDETIRAPNSQKQEERNDPQRFGPNYSQKRQMNPRR